MDGGRPTQLHHPMDRTGRDFRHGDSGRDMMPMASPMLVRIGAVGIAGRLSRIAAVMRFGSRWSFCVDAIDRLHRMRDRCRRKGQRQRETGE